MKKIFLSCSLVLIGFNAAYSQCACCSGASIGSSNGDNSNSAVTLGKKKFMIEGYGDYRSFMASEGGHHEPNPADSSAEEETPLTKMTITSLGIRYGLTDNITVSALMPFVLLNTDKGNDNGLGDLILLSTIKVYSKNKMQIALNAGMELPTGQQKSSNFDETTVVVGSGSFDPMAGVMFAKGWEKLSLKSNVFYKYTTKGFDNTNFGSLCIQNLTLGYQLKGQSALCSPTDSTKKIPTGFGWNIYGGYYGEWLGQISEDGNKDPNSGYYLGFATIGTSISTNGWSFPLTFSLPVLQELNGEQSHTAFRLRFGVTKMF